MAMLAAPPDALVRARDDILRRQFAVMFDIPLRGNFRVGRSKVVLTREHGPVGADGTTAATAP